MAGQARGREALAWVAERSYDHELRIRARRNQGAVALKAKNVAGVWASTRDVLRMLAEGTWERRWPGTW